MQGIYAKFDGYTLRQVTEADRPALEKWIGEDRRHDGVLDANYFLGRLGDGSEDRRPTCCALEDQAGTVFFIRLSRASRVRIQFGTARGARARSRVATALMKGMAFLEVALQRAGCEEWIFDTGDPRLAEMAKRHMGFEDSPDEMVRAIEPAERRKEVA